MTYKLHSLLTLRGNLGVPGNYNESWTIGIRFGDPITPHVGWITQSICDTLAANFSDFFSSQPFTSQVSFEEARLYDIDTSNHASTAPLISAVDPVVGSSGGWLPFQNSMVVTHVGAGLGVGRRGRVFLPPMQMAVQRDGKITDTYADALANGWGFFLTTCNTTLGGAAIAVISSGKAGGFIRPIVAVRVGHVMDTHRSRRRSLPEDASMSEVAVS